MNKQKPETRTGATEPEATQHLTTDQKKALDKKAEAEHTDGKERETLIQSITELGEESEPAGGESSTR